MTRQHLTLPRALTTARLSLAAPTRADTADLMALYGDNETAQFLGGPFSPEQTFRIVALLCGHWRLTGNGVYVARTADGRLVGAVGLLFPAEWPELEVTYTLASDARGKGYATEAVRAVIGAAAAAGAITVVSYIDPHNARSQAVARRLGARHGATIILRGEPCAVFRYDLAAIHSAEAAA